MKKKILAMAIAICSIAAISAQPRAIGARFGNNFEASYQHSLSDENYIQLDAGLIGYGHGIQLAGTYNWIFATPNWGSYGKWEWFGGIGAGLGYNWDFHNAYWKGSNVLGSWNGNHFFVGAVGNIGVSYTFEFPLQLSLDYRPTIGPSFGKYYNWNNDANEHSLALYVPGLYDFGFSVRYAF